MKLTRALGAVFGLLLLGACYPDDINAQLGPIEQSPGQGAPSSRTGS
jgi:hypothetical protein